MQSRVLLISYNLLKISETDEPESQILKMYKKIKQLSIFSYNLKTPPLGIFTWVFQHF